MLRVGLIGRIGAGKLTLLEAFKAAGALVINSDRIVEGLLAEPSIREQVWALANLDPSAPVEEFAPLFFADRDLMAKTEQILHPLLWKTIEHKLAGRPETTIAVIEITSPNVDARNFVDVLVRVEAPLAIRKERVIERDGSVVSFNARDSLQSGIDCREADATIDGTQSASELTAVIDELMSKWRAQVLSSQRKPQSSQRKLGSTLSDLPSTELPGDSVCEDD